ncbi:MAG: HYR domain-containing protein [Paludibacter sp.]|nr:HYR domain-containing protein [Paludibacter sp.]
MLLSLVLLCFAYTSQAQALKATGGTGLYKDRIWWMNFSGISLAAGASDSRDFAIGNGTIHITIDQVAFSGNISVSPYTDLSAVRLIGYNSYYSNAGLDQLYNIGGSESNNTLYYALSNNLNGGTSNSAPNNLPLIVTFRIRAYATYPSGVTTPLSLVFGSAETDDNSSAGYEYTQCTTNGSTWQLLEKANQDAAQIQKLSFSNNNLTARMMMGGYGSTGSVPNPANVALVYTTKSAATAASPLTVNSQFMSGGKSAIAIGFIVDQDGGDAVASYDNAVHIFQPLVSGGNPSQTSGTFDNFLSSTGAMGGTPVISAGTLTTPTDLYLGSVAPDNDATIFHSAANNQDEITGINDEDAILSPVYMTSCLTNYSIANIPVHNSLTAPATLIAWIDFNGDGVFSASEASTVQTIAVGQTVASLNWSGVASAPSGTRPIRLRITSDVMTASDAASTVNTGEVEDHTVIFSDVTIPTISISPVSIVANSTSSCGLSVATNNPTFNDDCGVVKLTWNMTGATTGSSLATGINYLGEQVFNVGLTTVTYTASDADGNSASCNFTVTITDNIAPTITTCAVARTVSGCSTAEITSPVYSSTLATSTYAEFSSLPNNGVASDNCLITTVQYQDVASGTCPTTVTRTWHFFDASGNESTCSQLITIQDLVKPTASNPSDIVVSIVNDPIPAPDISVVTDETDNCSAPTVTWLSDAAPTFSGCTETTVRTYKVTDACGNSISVVQNIIRSITTAAPLISAVTQPTCSTVLGSFTITNYDAANTYTFTPSEGVINTAGIVTAPAGTYTVTATSGTCTSVASASVTIDAQPLTPIAPILSAVTQPNCSVATGSFTITNYDATFTYAVIPSTGVTLSGNSITAPAGTYEVTATLGACTSMASSKVIVYAQPSTPAVTVGSVSSLCTNSTPTQLTGTPTGGLFNGTGVNIAGLFSPVVAGVGNHTITYTYTNQYGCSAVATTNVEVIAAPSLSVAPTAQTICSGSPAALSVSGDNGGTVNWTSNLLGLTGTGTSFNTGALFNKGTSPLTIILNASVTAGSCADNTNATVTVLPEPRVTVVPSSAVVCFYEIPHFTLSSVLTGTTINWQLINNVDSSIVNSGSGPDNITLFSSPIPAGSYTLKVTGSKDGCNSAAVNVPLVVN